MTVYTWLVVLLLLASLIFKGNRRHCTVFIVIAFIMLFAVMGLRDVYVTGNDTSGTFGSYPNIFRRIGTSEWSALLSRGSNSYNAGFDYLTKALYDLTHGDYQAYITIISLFVMISYMRFIGKYSPSPIQSILCFLGLLYYTLLFDVLKQAIAMAILLFAFDAVVKKRPVIFIILTSVAAFVHFPAIVFMPAYWIARMKVGRKYLTLLTLLLLVTFIFRDQLLNLMLNAYRDSDTTATMAGISFLRNKVIIMIAVAVFAVLIRPPSSKDVVYNAMMMFLGIAIVFQTFCGYNNTFERLADYYFHTSIVLIPLIFEKRDELTPRYGVIKNERVLSYMMLFICAFAIWRFLSVVNNASSFMSHQFFWQR